MTRNIYLHIHTCPFRMQTWKKNVRSFEQDCDGTVCLCVRACVYVCTCVLRILFTEAKILFLTITCECTLFHKNSRHIGCGTLVLWLDSFSYNFGLYSCYCKNNIIIMIISRLRTKAKPKADRSFVLNTHPETEKLKWINLNSVNDCVWN
jgi:hypothetical protein